MIYKKIAIAFSIALVLIGGITSKKAYAEEIVITGNGSDSVNEVVTTSENNTSIESSNNTNINNSVSVDANTGGNSVSDTTNGDTAVVTGDIRTSTDVVNEGNVNHVQADQCCSQKGTISIISGNGSNSFNSVTSTQNTNLSVTANNTANIVNNIAVNANTGNNTANNNSGNVYIQTGSITVKEKIVNAPINLTWIDAAIAKNIAGKMIISGNGAYSHNTLDFMSDTNVDIQVTNLANIFNNSLLNLSTGWNEANDNNGNVTLVTGDITADIAILNEVNSTKTVIDCKCQEKAPEKPVPAAPVEKVSPPTSGGGGSNNHSSSGEVAGIALESLPVTGTNWLFLAFIGNVMMLLLGMILRLRSGNAPGAVAVA